MPLKSSDNTSHRLRNSLPSSLYVSGLISTRPFLKMNRPCKCFCADFKSSRTKCSRFCFERKQSTGKALSLCPRANVANPAQLFAAACAGAAKVQDFQDGQSGEHGKFDKLSSDFTCHNPQLQVARRQVAQQPRQRAAKVLPRCS